jgi:hypothetical protein
LVPDSSWAVRWLGRHVIANARRMSKAPILDMPLLILELVTQSP